MNKIFKQSPMTAIKTICTAINIATISFLSSDDLTLYVLVDYITTIILCNFAFLHSISFHYNTRFPLLLPSTYYIMNTVIILI